MSIGAGGIRAVSLMLGLALGTTAAVAQTSSGGAWTDPPARGSAAPAASPPAAASPVAPAQDPASGSANGRVGKAVEKAVESAPVAHEPAQTAPSVAQASAVPKHERVREAKRPRPRVAARAPRVRAAGPRFTERRETVRPMPRRIVAGAYRPRTAAQPYPYAPLPVGRVAGPVDGERNPIFTDGDDRMRRIAAAQAAGYLVVRARSLRVPDDRTMRGDRDYDDDDGQD